MSVYISKFVRALSCPLIASGIFGLMQKQPNPISWWSLISIGIVFTIYDVMDKNPIASKENKGEEQ